MKDKLAEQAKERQVEAGKNYGLNHSKELVQISAQPKERQGQRNDLINSFTDIIKDNIPQTFGECLDAPKKPKENETNFKIGKIAKVSHDLY